jgi:hypothetical protein
MAERVLRGSRLGSTSYETDRNTELAPRQDVAFDCSEGHVTVIPMATDAEIPAVWECRVCGRLAKVRSGSDAVQKAVKPVRSHWDMLLERRSVDELEDILAERLDELHASTAARKSA